MDLPPLLADLATDQLGLLTRRQLAEHDVSVGQVRWRLARSWRMVLPGVVQLTPGLTTGPQRNVAALLYAGPQSWLAGPTAASHFGFLHWNADPRVHVLVPPSVKPRSMQWVTIRRTSLTDERLVEVGPLRISCRARAVVDAAAVLPEDAARALVIDVVRRRMVRLEDVAHWVEYRQSQGRLRLRRALAEAAAGSWSLPEADLARLVTTSRSLPEPWCNPSLTDASARRLTTPDLWFDDVGMAVMVHSRAFHAGSLQWDETVRGDSDLSSHRIVVVGVTPEQLAHDPASVLRRIEAHHEAAQCSGFRPDVIATRRSGWIRSA